MQNIIQNESLWQIPLLQGSNVYLLQLSEYIQTQQLIPEELMEHIKQVIKFGYAEFHQLNNDQIITLLIVTLSVIQNNSATDSFSEFLVFTKFLHSIDILINEKGNENEQIKKYTFQILMKAIENPVFRKDVIDLNISHIAIKSFHKTISKHEYQYISDFIRILVQSGDVHDDQQLDEMKEFYVNAICHKKITVILDALEWYIRFTNALYFDMIPTHKFVQRINQLYKYRFRNTRLQFLLSRLSIFIE